MASLTQAQLREELVKALKDAKSMFSDGLVDEQEYGDLKSHELAKYKAAVAALSSAPPATARFQPETSPNSKSSKPAPLEEGLEALPGASSARHEAAQTSSPALSPERTPEDNEFIPPAAVAGSVAVDPDMYERLRTPPIFRRRSAALRRTVVLNGTDADSLRHSLSFD
jgi:hypothetical protein